MLERRTCPMAGWGFWPAATIILYLGRCPSTLEALYSETRRVGLTDGELSAVVMAPMYLGLRVWSRALRSGSARSSSPTATMKQQQR